MSKTSSLHCYFGCEEGALLHDFPKPHVKRFSAWKAVLSEESKRKDDMYIYNTYKLCNKHFEENYLSLNKQLTRKAVPTLFLEYSNGATVEKNLLKNMGDNQKDLEDLCRVCLNASYFQMKSLLDTQNAKIVQDIEFCTGVMFKYEAHKPYRICSECLYSLSIAKEFKTTCIKSEGIIKEAAVKVETKEEFDYVDGDNLPMDTDVEDVKSEASIIDLENDCDNDGSEVSDPKDSAKCIKQNKKLKVRKNTRKCDKTQKLKKKPRKLKVIKKATPKTPKVVNRLHCEKCDIKFDSVEESRAHRAKFHTDSQCICEVCGKTLMSRASMSTHVRFHRPLDYSCDSCAYRTNNKYDLGKHVRIHSDFKQYQCPLCVRAYYTNSNLHQHLRRIHGAGGGRRFTCSHDACGKSFENKSKLLRHQDMHDNIKRHPCTVCDSAFTRRCYLKKHLEKHHNITIPRLKSGRRKELRIIHKNEPEIT
ncbi:zinc finger protein 26-like isoform X2 [Aricia agestis]|uniref:zinc finger protein 26-like isoform X2 n=1 Tax=Aricia agestis TaxID=91739 RepID=UPI001C20A8B5|nr:zinc finger protein 26-like isoform X2 [Aricia agestis]